MDDLLEAASKPKTARPAAGRRFVTKLHTSLESAESVWRRLERDGVCTAFQRFDWVRLLAQRLVDPRTCDWQIVEAQCADTGEALLVLPLIRTRMWGYRVTEFVCFDVCDYTAPIMAADLGLDDSEIAALWQSVRTTLGPTDVLRVSGLVASHGGHANPLARLAGATPSRHSAMSMRLAGDAETVLERCCKPSFVRDYRKYARKLARKDTVSFAEARTSEEVNAIFDTLLRQRLARFEKLGRFDLLARPEVAAFYRDVALNGLADGSTRLFALKCGAATVATFYALTHRDTFHGLMISIDDEAWRSYSPGALTYSQTIEWARRQGLAYYDLAVGVPEYKTAMGLEGVQVLEFTEVLTTRGMIAARSREAADKLEAFVRRHPALFERLRRLRRALRRATTRARPT